MNTTTYRAAAYARASKDDPDSSTIENQIDLIREYAKSQPEIEIVSVRADSGFSGVNFVRPDFIEMMKNIEAGKINCVIVKDSSRLGRNYIEVGELMDVEFPKRKVRLIAVNDNYDSNNPRTRCRIPQYDERYVQQGYFQKSKIRKGNKTIPPLTSPNPSPIISP
ncbi:MAG: recombinase family protein [Defluviitaleaceae bacterium]|nr:recombinase family protein [Defluviitaleaceae bacterium]